MKDINIGLRAQYKTYAQQKCFVAYSEQARWSVDFLCACEEVLSQPEYNLEIDYARKHFEADVPLRQKVLELIANAQYCIYDLSYWRQDERSPWQMPRNVMIELGIAIALNRPILLLRHASNRDLPLPKGLQGISDQILEFSGTTILKRVLTEHLPRWFSTTLETAWWSGYCTFGGQICTYRSTHPRARQALDNKKLNCAISDGADVSRIDFQGVLEDILARFSDVNYTYLDSPSLREGYNSSLCNHCQITRSSSLAIYKVTPQTPAEAFISIGISLALETQFEYRIPKILIAEDIQNIPSLLSGYDVAVIHTEQDTKLFLKESIPEVIRRIHRPVWKTSLLPFAERETSQLNSLESENSASNSLLEQVVEDQVSEELESSPDSSSLKDVNQDLDNNQVKQNDVTGELEPSFLLKEQSKTMRKSLNLDLTSETYELLQQLAEESGKNMADVLRTGLALYGMSQEENKKGRSLGVVEGEKVVKEIVSS